MVQEYEKRGGGDINVSVELYDILKDKNGSVPPNARPAGRQRRVIRDSLGLLMDNLTLSFEYVIKLVEA
jgi:hypothetical protein